ncbi:polysaccharide pyruvyl transferase family protein [Micromonospora sp. DR5-3]|uniref:polysaccharide pyruvyl transferase family protein n=1 Tax=unclassified Micromonospora TaxID=2617518 RepID=UPI0016528D4A|nr:MULTISPECIES: polysaccharide pyruvyl transferase family protein [unclassified Micromonospora]MCW3818990.1 polysaccharide pyruvyl transferase family protein [Micromonospora sp. DR5-3]
MGDQLTPWLVRRIAGVPARWVPPEGPGTRFLVTGSVAALAGPGAVVWGSGVMAADERVRPGVELVTVRGPLTREVARRTVDCPPVYGDPALLLPRFLPHRRRRGGPPGVAPHFSDKARAALGTPPGWRLVDVQRPVEEFVDAVVGCSFVASSSLHGIIVAHAYGVPAVWITYGDLPSGDGTKFHDHYLSVGLPVPAPVPVGRTGAGLDAARLAELATVPTALPDLDLLLARCPFR